MVPERLSDFPQDPYENGPKGTTARASCFSTQDLSDAENS